MFKTPYRTVTSIAGVATFTASLLLVASPVEADTSTTPSGPWQEAAFRQEPPETTPSGMRMWSDLNDTPDVPVEYAENVSGARSGGGMVIEFSSSTSSSTFAWAASRYDVESLSADGRQVTVRSSDDNELARLAALARNVDSRSSTREFPLGNFTTLGSAPSSNDPLQNSDD